MNERKALSITLALILALLAVSIAAACTTVVAPETRECGFYSRYPIAGADGNHIGWVNYCDRGDSTWFEPVGG